MRVANIRRKTNETLIKVKLDIDGAGKSRTISEIGFFNHLLDTFAKHGLFNLKAEIRGDTDIDQHHTVEDTGIVLGNAFKTALGDKRGLKRTGFFIYPMDEALAMAAIDLSGRPYLRMESKFRNKKVGDFSTELLEDFFGGFVSALGAALHIRIYCGRSDHHKIEAIFKALGKALKEACEREDRSKKDIPSTKGIL